MKVINKGIALFTLASFLGSGLAFAQPSPDHDRDHGHDHDHYVRHRDWRRGSHIDRRDWDRGRRVDYRHYHLRRPPRGYEWREVDGNYVLAAVATGVIASVIIASTVH